MNECKTCANAMLITGNGANGGYYQAIVQITFYTHSMIQAVAALNQCYWDFFIKVILTTD